MKVNSTLPSLARKIHHVAVLGAGTMGAQIAAHFANAGIPVYLFDLKGKSSPNEIIEKTLAGLAKMNPQPFSGRHAAALITPANYDDHLADLTRCELVIEAVAERLDIKQSLYERIGPYLHPAAILGTNTSGLSIKALSEHLPPAFQSRFCGLHFFNPPRYMPLIECIPGPKTDQKLLDDLESFLTSFLGKSMVRAKDTPNFIANRIGVFSMLAVCAHTEGFNLGLEIVDQLTGKSMGRPKSATYRTADVVGLDVFAHVVKTMETQLMQDPFHHHFKLPAWIEHCIKQGALGQKTKKGLYFKGPKELLVLDLKTLEYRPSTGKIYAGVKQLLKEKDLAKKLKRLMESDHPEAQFMWAVYRDLFHYTAIVAAEIAHSVRDIDLALRFGFGWDEGPFETWQQAGWGMIRDAIQADIAAGKTLSSAPLPDWVHRMDGPYKNNQAYVFASGQFESTQFLPVYERQLFREAVYLETFDEGETVFENEGIRAWHQGDGHLIVSFKTKMCVVGDEVLSGLKQAIRLAEERFQSLILWQRHSSHFCAGADLMQFATKFANGGLPAIEQTLKDFQQTNLALRYAKVPTIAALQGYVLGGGCEIAMHCDRAVAALETYMGLVEVGVGLLPSAGGCKEMALRALNTQDPEKSLQAYFKNIAMAEVAKSAHEAIEKGYLRPHDLVVFHPKEILYVAKSLAQMMATANYTPPVPPQIKAQGRDALANLLLMIVNLRDGGFASEYDATIAGFIADIMTGGRLEPDQRVDEEWMLRKERAHFLTLVQQEKTHQRIEHMLETGKPLRN